MGDYLQLQSLTINAFDGGMTDNYIDAPINAFKTGDNLLLTKNKKLLTRPGSRQYHSTAYRVTTARVGKLINYNNDTALIAHSAADLYTISTGAWAALTGPTGNSAFPGSTSANVVSASQYKQQVYLTSDKLTAPMKVYLSSGSPVLINAGLPTIDFTPTFTTELSPLYSFGNSLITARRAHGLDLTQHTAAHTISADGFGSAFEYSLEGFVRFGEALDWLWDGYTANYGHEEDAARVSGWGYHIAQRATSHAFASHDWATIAGIVAALDDAKTKLNAHDADTTAHTLGSLHQISTTAPYDPEYTAAQYCNSYIYGFAWCYTYTIDGVEYEDIGPIMLADPIKSIREGSKVIISGLPVLANGTTDNFDTTNIKLKIFRTEGNGTTLYELAEISNGTTTYTDNHVDVNTTVTGTLVDDDEFSGVLTDNETAYTNGGVLDNDPPPASKFVHIENGVALWGYLKEDSTTYPNRVRQSVEEDPDSCPGSLNSDFDEEVCGINGSRGKHIVLCKNKIYRRDGYYDELGNGTVTHDKISETAGCVSNASCVQTQEGLFWAGNDGFYFTDGYQVLKISDGLEDTYTTITSTSTKKSRILGAYDQKHNIIVWTTQYQSTSTDCDTLFVLNLNGGIRPSSCITTWSGDTSFSPTAICLYSNQLVRAGGMTDGTLPGYLFKHDDSYYSDLRMVSGVADPANWPKKTIIHDYIGPCVGFGVDETRKWVGKIMTTAKNRGGLSLQINSYNDDDSSSIKALKPIRFSETYGLMKEWRRFPAGGLRCDYKQIQITNAYTYIKVSDDMGLATVNATAKTCTLAAGHTEHWPTDSVDYYLSFANDNYVRQYLVTARTDDALTFSDSGNNCPSGSTKWQLKGYPKDEVLELHNYVLKWAPVGDTEKAYDGDSGANE